MMSNWQGWLYVAAVLVPLVAFVVELLGGRWLKHRNAFVATGAIGISCLLSLIGLTSYFFHSGGMPAPHAHAESPSGVPVGNTSPREGTHSARDPLAWTGHTEWVVLSGATALGASTPPVKILAGIHIDNLAVIMFVMVTFIALLVHIYAIEYMRGDPHYPRFFTYLSLFCFSMLGLVAAASIFWVFVFWELVGLCSYLLIGFWYERKSNSDAANKAFITNRIGDVGMLIGLGLLWSTLGTFEIAEINRSLRDEGGRLHQVTLEDGQVAAELRQPGKGGGAAEPVINRVTEQPYRIPLWMLTVAGLGIFAGCVGKSAQFPLHVWLPDAMAGPTPVSALIHAATMVAAGVYLVGRFFPLFTEDARLVIGYTGGITLFIAASIAMVQVDYKKVLAYSTVSQLGFMMLGLGVGGWSAGLFHLLTHASFKALLFLGAGSVHHAVHTYDLTRLGGLYSRMKVTAWTMLLGTMAIAGVPLLSGFYSKDAILAAALAFVKRHPDHLALMVLPAVGAMMTAFYMFRMWFLIFTGPSRGQSHAEHGHGDLTAHAHESPRLMTWPLIALAVPTVVAGWPLTILPLSGEPILEGWLLYGEPAGGIDVSAEHVPAFAASLIIAALGIGLGVLCYGPIRALRWIDPEGMARRLGPLHRFLLNKWYFDEIYEAVLVRPVLALARAASAFDRHGIDGLVNGAARITVRLSSLEGLFDRVGVDGLVNVVAWGSYALGDRARWLQTGRLRGYLMFLSAAVLLLFLGLFFWIRG